MDGLLLNTEAFYTTVQKQILAEYGYDFTWELKAQVCRAKMRSTRLLRSLVNCLLRKHADR